MTKYAIYINPMHGILLEADDHEVVQSTLVLKKDGNTMAQFTQYLGWHIINEKEKEPATVFSIVPGPKPPEVAS